MYLAEFAYPGTVELANDVLIAASEEQAREFALEHALAWGVELFSLRQATEYQVQLYHQMRKVVTLLEVAS